MGAAGLNALQVIDVPTPYIYPDLGTAVRGQLSSGPARMAIERAGADATTQALADAMKPATQPDGTIRMDNIFKIVIARA